MPESATGSHRLDISGIDLTLIYDQSPRDDRRMRNRNAIRDDEEVASAERLTPERVCEPAVKSTIEQHSDAHHFCRCELAGGLGSDAGHNDILVETGDCRQTGDPGWDSAVPETSWHHIQQQEKGEAMVQEEFQQSKQRPEFPLPPAKDFPESGVPAEQVLSDVAEMMRKNPAEAAQDFTASYVGPPHPISKHIPELVAGTFFTEWAREIQPAAFQMEKEATRMMASLLGRPEAVGFITSGGTESNMSAMRLARNLAGISQPEVVMPESGHYSFRIAADVLGINLREARLREDFSPDMDHVESLISNKTVALVCSVPEGFFGQLDPVAEFSKLAQEKNIYLHVDGAFGGFILPFMRELGHDVAPFDFSLPGVSSMMTDGHKLGMLPVATGFFLVRDEEMLQAIPTERTVIHNLTATKNGDRAATAWATMRHLGREGYRASVRHVLELRDHMVSGIEQIDGLRMAVRPHVTVLNFTSDLHDMEKVAQNMLSRGWGTSYLVNRGIPCIRLSIHPTREMEHVEAFLRALEDSVDGTQT